MRLSEALRAAAEAAPVEEASVSTAAAGRRIARRRAVRTGSVGALGVGVVAVLGVGVVAPLLSSMTSSGSGADSAPAMASEAPDMESQADGAESDSAEDSAGGAAGESMLASPFVCGAAFSPEDPAWSYGDTSGVTFDVGDAELTGGSYEVERHLTATRAVDLVTGGDYVIVWDGIIIGSYLEPDPLTYGPADEPSLPEGEVYERLDPATDFATLESWQTIEPVNCWDGAALPAAEYEVYLAQTLAYPDASTDLGVEMFRVAAGPVTLAVEGPAPVDPFGEYLGGAAQ
ncbi:hypothetical protein [Demequina sp. NBRC 110057]|uniref:hypothetical protein n=1 Tax=Demequina sp. NBRC 110057 TaxID=1570346 RepID=UPI000A03E99F|nr:hypothetical protein [Demequina sp. NBRC 110057]